MTALSRLIISKPHIRIHVSQYFKGLYFAVVFKDRTKCKIIGAVDTSTLPLVIRDLKRLAKQGALNS